MNVYEQMVRIQQRVKELWQLDLTNVPEMFNYVVTDGSGNIYIATKKPVFVSGFWMHTGRFLLADGTERQNGDLFHIGWLTNGPISDYATRIDARHTEEPPFYKPFDLLRHYKGGVYTILTICKIEATGAVSYAYRGTDGEVWVRPKAEIEDPKRFTPIKL